MQEETMEIKVCGPGCVSCEKTQKIVEAAVALKGVPATVVKVKDFQEIVRHEAARKMRVGPSGSACRSRLQTTLSCCGKEPW
jgi:hypothetical protein